MHQHECSKCGHHGLKTGELRAAGGFWSKIFDIQSKRFNTVSCKNCGYTELYAKDSSIAGNVFDFLSQ